MIYNFSFLTLINFFKELINVEERIKIKGLLKLPNVILFFLKKNINSNKKRKSNF